jgi:hypothetical protein
LVRLGWFGKENANETKKGGKSLNIESNSFRRNQILKNRCPEKEHAE